MPTYTLFVGGIGPRASLAEIESEFLTFGRCICSFKGNFGFVEFDDRKQAKEAMLHIHGMKFNGERLGVDWKKQKTGPSGADAWGPERHKVGSTRSRSSANQDFGRSRDRSSPLRSNSYRAHRDSRDERGTDRWRSRDTRDGDRYVRDRYDRDRYDRRSRSRSRDRGNSRRGYGYGYARERAYRSRSRSRGGREKSSSVMSRNGDRHKYDRDRDSSSNSRRGVGRGAGQRDKRRRSSRDRRSRSRSRKRDRSSSRVRDRARKQVRSSSRSIDGSLSPDRLPQRKGRDHSSSRSRSKGKSRSRSRERIPSRSRSRSKSRGRAYERGNSRSGERGGSASSYRDDRSENGSPRGGKRGVSSRKRGSSARDSAERGRRSRSRNHGRSDDRSPSGSKGVSDRSRSRSRSRGRDQSPRDRSSRAHDSLSGQVSATENREENGTVDTARVKEGVEDNPGDTDHQGRIVSIVETAPPPQAFSEDGQDESPADPSDADGDGQDMKPSASTVEGMALSELREELKLRKLNFSGKRPALTNRLRAAMES